MYLTFFLSLRFLESRKNSNFISIISAITIGGISLGVAALIITVSILSGFENTISQKLINFDSHIKIVSYADILPDYKNEQIKVEKLIGNSIGQIVPYASKLSIISSGKIKEGVNIKGVPSASLSNYLKNNSIIGSIELTESTTAPIVLGKKLANKLLVKPGDQITIFSLKDDRLPSQENLPTIKRFKVIGLFESGMSEFDDLFAYVNLEDAQSLFSIGNNITGYDITLANPSAIDSITNVLANKLKYPYSVHSIYEIHKNIFTWIGLQKQLIPVVLFLITFVAIFNIVGTLLLVIIEKTNEIGILKTLGSKNKLIVSIFMYYGLFISVIGIFIGNLLALTFILLQKEFNIISLPSSVYFVNSVPVDISILNFVSVSGLALLLCLVASILPSYIASRINPLTSLRFS